MVTKEILKNSIEAKWRKHQRNIYIICGIAILFISCFIIVPLELHEFGIIDMLKSALLICMPVFIIFIPTIIYYSIVYKNTYKVLDDYKIYEVVLDKPSPSFWYKHSFYYKISFKTEDGTIKSFDTNAMFGNIFSPNSIEDYNNQKIKIAYSGKYDKIIILGKKESGDDFYEWL